MKLARPIKAVLAVTALLLLIPGPGWADNVLPPTALYDVRDKDEFKPEWIVLPFAFSTDSFDFTIGVGGGGTGYLQEQAGLYGAALTTANQTHAFYFLGTNLRMPRTERLFFDALFSAGYFTDKRDYVGINNPDYEGERAGSNSSSNDNFISDEGVDSWGELKFKYILPMGGGRETGFLKQTLDRGLLVSEPTGASTWNPLKSGLTMLYLEPFFRHRSLEFGDVSGSGNTNGLKFALIYDNRDFSPNPSRGSNLQLGLRRDFGWFNSLNSYTVLEGSYSKYLSFGNSRFFRQRVLALNAWTSDNTTWNIAETEEGPTIENRATPSKGSTLGGYNRMRAYPMNRFHDKAAVYYGAELRLIPQWNPLRQVKFLGFLDVDWMQLVGIFEVGRVAPEWDLKELHSDLKWDAGFGLRGMMRKVIVRLDTCFTDGAWGVWAMAGQPF
jgi:hypothetical protein